MKLSRPSAIQLAVFAGIALLLLAITVVVPSLASFEVTHPDTPQGPTIKGRVVEVLSRETVPSERGDIEKERVSVDVNGLRVIIDRTRAEGDVGQLDVEAGDRVLLSKVAGPSGESYYIVDRVRQTTLLWLVAAFVIAVVVTGRVVGVTSLLGLGASMLVLLRFIVPGILSGRDPILIAVAGALTIMASTLFLAHGVNRKTVVALVGTAVALLFTALLATVTIAAADLTGLASEDTAVLQVLSAEHLSASGLLLGGIIIGSLGVLDDVTVAQASAVFELRSANALLGPLELYRRAMNVGRDHIAATVNTLVLAYAGASLPLLMLLAIQGEPLSIQVNREFVAIEIVRSLVGSIGLVAAVPFTTAIAAAAAGRTGSADATGTSDSPAPTAAVH